jgi:hypothetical protein
LSDIPLLNFESPVFRRAMKKWIGDEGFLFFQPFNGSRAADLSRIAGVLGKGGKGKGL